MNESSLLSYVGSCGLLTVPIFAWNIIFACYLPPALATDEFWRDIPLLVEYGENGFRFAIVVLPFLMPLKGDDGFAATRIAAVCGGDDFILSGVDRADVFSAFRMECKLDRLSRTGIYAADLADRNRACGSQALLEFAVSLVDLRSAGLWVHCVAYHSHRHRLRTKLKTLKGNRYFENNSPGVWMHFIRIEKK